MNNSTVDRSRSSGNSDEVAAETIALVAPLVYVPIGIVGNILSILVYKHQWTHVDWRPFLTFLIFLASVDTFYLAFCTPLWWLLSQLSLPHVCILTKIASYSSNVINFLDVWIITIMSIYRLRTMLIPSRLVTLKLSTTRVLALLLSLSFLSLCLNSHILFALSNEYDSVGERCPLFSPYEFWYTKVWRWLSLLLNSGIPGVIVIIVNSSIIYKRQKTKENVYSISDQQHHQHDQHDEHTMNDEHHNLHHKRHLRERMMTASLLTLSFGVIGLTAPYLVYKILVDPPLIHVESSVSSLLRQLLVNILCLRYASNVFAFLLASEAFRQDLSRILTLKCIKS